MLSCRKVRSIHFARNSTVGTRHPGDSLSAVRFVAIAIAVVLIGGRSSAAQTPTPPRRGEIHGVAVNSATKSPISNANIEVTIAGATTPAGRAVTTADG